MSCPKVLLTILPVFWPGMPAIGLGYLQSYLAQNGINSGILDLNNIFYNLADERLKKQWRISCNVQLENSIHSILKNAFTKEYNSTVEKFLAYDIIGFSCFKSNFSLTLEITKIIKLKRKDIKIIFGGPEITRQYFKSAGKFDEEILHLADFLVVGEGEKALCDYINRGDFKIARFSQLESLDALAFPKYAGVDFSTYPKKDALAVQFSRGCIRKCAFCSERLLYKGFRRRKAGSVIDEIGYYRKNHNMKRFVFFDSLINADLAALEELCDKIMSDFGFIDWEAQIAVRPDMKQEIFRKMKKSGCFNLFVGLESGSDRTLKSMNKGFTSLQAKSFFKQLNDENLSFGVSMIVGFPGESEVDFKDSLDFIIRNKDLIPKIEQVNPFTYYDGTPVDRSADYSLNTVSLKRLEIFIREIKNSKIKHTNAFLGNLIKKDAGV